MQQSGLKIKWLTTGLCACLALSVTASLSADTDLMVTNDGRVLSAIVGSSSEDVLSTSIRVVGPDDFVFEGRVEGNAIDWFPDEGLEDGIYHWEAWTVTVNPGAEMREVIDPMERKEMDEGAIQHRIDHTPLERFFNSGDKNVTTESGSFRIRGGWLEEVNEGDTFSATQNEFNPNLLQRLIGGVFDFVVPSAHAQQTFTQDIEISKNTPRLIYDTTFGDNTVWEAQAQSTGYALRWFDDNPGGTRTPFNVEKGAPTDSLRVRSGGSIGLGTGSPAQSSLHIRHATRPQIRLEDAGESQSWFIKAANQGAFEIGETWFNTEFISSHSSFRIYPETPEGAMQIQGHEPCILLGPGNVVCGQKRGRVGINTHPLADLHVRSTEGPQLSGFPNHTDATIRLERSSGTSMQIAGGVSLRAGRPGGNTSVFSVHGDAPNNSLRISADGSVGVGINNPAATIHVTRDDGTAEILVEESQFEEVNRQMIMRSNGNTGFVMQNSSNDRDWEFRTGGQGGSSNVFLINYASQAGPELRLTTAGNLFVKGTVSGGSSRESKTNIRRIDTDQAIESLRSLQLHEWSYIDSPDRHVGPMAEDFYEIFGYGGRPDSIAPSDLASLALLSAQHLLEENQGIREQNAELRARLEQIELQLGAR